jgi:hypothetical protein
MTHDANSGTRSEVQYAELLERCLLLEEQKNNACLARDKYLIRLRSICEHDCGGDWNDRGELRCRRCESVMAESVVV